MDRLDRTYQNFGKGFVFEGNTLSGLALEDLPSEFMTGTASDGSLVLTYGGGVHSVTLAGVAADAFFVV